MTRRARANSRPQLRLRPKLRLRLGLRARLGLAALALAVLALGGGMTAARGFQQSRALAAEAFAAQARVEGWGAVSARVNDWMLAWLGPQRPSDQPVQAAFRSIDALIAADVAAAPDAHAANLRARQSLTLARVRGHFSQLAAGLAAAPVASRAGDSLLAAYATQAPALLAQQITQEARRRDQALIAMDGLSRRLAAAGLAWALCVPLALGLAWAGAIAPLLRRLDQARQAADRPSALGANAASAAGLGAALGAGLERGRHDELGLMLAHIRRAGLRLDRRARAIAADRARLETIVAERTAALRAANAQLSQADAERRRFFADVGHELRTPLTVILGEAELGQAHPDPALRQSFRTIQGRAQRLSRRIEDLLRIARSESGQLDLDCGPVALACQARRAAEDLAPLLARAGVSVAIDLPEDLRVAGDGDWLRQVFAGIFDNAAKYAGRGAAVRLVLAPPGEGQSLARIAITDSGPGLAPGAETRLLQRFQRGDDSRRRQGFGLGLALAAWVIEAQGGRLTLGRADLAAGGGLRIDLDLPLWAGAGAPIAAAPAPLNTPPSTGKARQWAIS